MCNAVSVLPETIDKGVEILRSKKDFDSAITVTGFNMFSPIRARKVAKDGSLIPFVPFENFNFKVDSNRQKKDTVYFHHQHNQKKNKALGGFPDAPIHS